MGKEDLIIDESQEISLGEDPTWLKGLFGAFPAFKFYNYRLYFTGQLVSMIGSWLQTVAQGWLVLKLTNSPYWLGVVAALNMLPVLLFSLPAGVIIDKFGKRKIIILTQLSLLGLAITLGVLTIFNLVTLTHICIIAFLIGVINALDNPARQSFVAELVDKKVFHSAIALNSATYNSARVIGPALAGMLISLLGVGGAFILNGLSFLAVVTALSLMKLKSQQKESIISPLEAIKQGLRYSLAHPLIKTLLIIAGYNSIFAWSFATILPAIAKNTFFLDAGGLGLLYTSIGVGALVAAGIVSATGKKVNRLIFILGGNLVFALSIFALSLTTFLPLAFICLGLMGLSLISLFSTLNSTIQGVVKDQFRGRVMSIYTLVFLGLSPIGNFLEGLSAQNLGNSPTLQINALMVLVFSFFIYSRRKQIS